MSKEKHGICKDINVGQLPRYSRLVRLYLYNDCTEYMEPINIWNHNISVIKEQKDNEEKLLQK